MKVRMTRAEYAAGMRAAKGAGMTFAKWASMMTIRHLKRKVEGEVMEAGRLSRENSVSVYVGCKGVRPAIVRRAVAEAVVVDDSLIDWGYKWRKDVLDAVIYVQGFEGNVMDYAAADKFMDEKLELRKNELTTSTYAKATADRKNAKKERKA